MLEQSSTGCKLLTGATLPCMIVVHVAAFQSAILLFRQLTRHCLACMDVCVYNCVHKACRICLLCLKFSKRARELQSKRLRWLGHTFGMPNERLPKKFLSGQVQDCCPQVALGSESTVLHRVTVVQAASAGRSEQTALARQDLTCTYLTHYELESVLLFITVVIDIL